MPRRGARLLLAALILCCAPWCRAADFAAVQPSPDARYAAERVLLTGDAMARPFAIVDKVEARIYVFDAAGHLLGASPLLLGMAVGDIASRDAAVADTARLRPASLAPADRSTPSGRFETQPGHNDSGEPIVWVDYDASLALHRLRPAAASERRPERLASPTPDDNRISLGCLVVPVAFYDGVVAASLGAQRGVVYVLPETRPARTLFDALEFAALF
ncbi:MAG TPA: L,D-transpeptidase [Burkholderiaceae bacterium]|nr:L,D-transpeptidase [Burkholderiaceae bacterium]